MEKAIVKFKEKTDSMIEVQRKFEENGVSTILSKSLSLRNINNLDIVKFNFKMIGYENILNIDKMVNELVNIVYNKSKNLIYIVADYDCDGATSCSLIYMYLKKIGINIKYIVPNRFSNGYGLSKSIIKEFENEHPEYIITVDNGTASYEGIDYAHEKGIKVLVTDHHLAAKDKLLPNADVIVNPNQPDDKSGLNNLSGCGVVFYILKALNDKLINMDFFNKNKIDVINMDDYLDIVALSTIADVVFLDDNNRLIVKMGLDKIKTGYFNNGIKSLCEVSKKNFQELNSLDFGFAIGPRINAAGRLEDMTIGIKCLTSDSLTDSILLSNKLNNLNIQRKDIENEMKDVSLELINNQLNSKYTKVVYDSSFHEGVVGIIAGKIKEKFNRPTIVFSDAQEKGYLKGSGRSIEGFHLRDAIDLVYKEKPECFKGFGGHSMAAGVTIKKEFLEEFKNIFENYSSKLLKTINIDKIYNVDGELSGKEINKKNAKDLCNYVWGQGFLEPIWYGKFNVLEVKVLAGKHLKYILEKDGYIFDAIEFNNIEQNIKNDSIEIVYKLSINHFNNIEKIQLLIQDSYIKTEFN